MPLSLPCPAKINLFLEVRGKRPDGFHELGTLFQAVETGDTLHAAPLESPDRDVVLDGAEGLTANPEDNLIVRAARLLQNRYADRIPQGFGIRFTLEKRLPSGAGLGGGSSDAATALRLTNTIWRLDLTPAELRILGAELGSDVPFFLSTPTAYGESRGEALAAAPPPRPFHVLIATPHCHVDTAGAYRLLAEYRTRVDGGIFGSRWEAFRREYPGHAENAEFYRNLHNDFEAPVLEAYPEIGEIRKILIEYSPVKAMLSGSGASVFALFSDEKSALAAQAAAAPRCRFAVVTRFWGQGSEIEGFF